MKKLYIVIPCYNEEKVLPETSKRIEIKMSELIKQKEVSKDSKVMFVDDGSKDKTWEIIKSLNEKNKLFVGLKLSRNRGHQNALLAGLMTSKGSADMIISMDADLQDDINAIDKFVAEYNKGNDIVYGVRSKREKDTFFKKFTAEGFYKFMKKMGVDIVFNHADYRLMSKRTLDALEQYEEVNLFLRGIVPLIGYKSSTVMYERNERFAGESKYPLKKMLAFAFDGITSFSVKPIRMIFTVGMLMFIFSLVIMLYSLIRYFGGNTVEGWTFISISIWMIAGVQMLSLGIIGEYIGKIYSETKKRPRYIIEENLENEK
jgi:glycosyltransferase involved in cell wall biosynthesis